MAGPQISQSNMSAEWQDQARCAGHPYPDLFHPEPGGMTKAKAQQIRDAKTVCGPCPVKSECLGDALDNDLGGIRGGLTEQERSVATRHARAAAIASNRPNAPTWNERCGTYSGAGRHRTLSEQMCQPCREARNVYEAGRKKRKRDSRRLDVAS